MLAIIANIKLIVVEESPDGFYHRGDTFEYVEGGGPEQPTVVSIRGNTLGHRVESHFERLVSKVQLESIKAKTRAIAEECKEKGIGWSKKMRCQCLCIRMCGCTHS